MLLEDYGLIGDMQAAALVGRNGSVDWLCLPQFDSPACFAALLGDESHGRWLLGPDEVHSAVRRYVDDTAVLETTYTTAHGEVRVTDLMPTGERRADVVRRVEGLSGTVTVRHSWLVRFDYGRVRPWVHREDLSSQPAIVAVAGPDPKSPEGAWVAVVVLVAVEVPLPPVMSTVLLPPAPPGPATAFPPLP